MNMKVTQVDVHRATIISKENDMPLKDVIKAMSDGAWFMTKDEMDLKIEALNTDPRMLHYSDMDVKWTRDAYLLFAEFDKKQKRWYVRFWNWLVHNLQWRTGRHT